MPATKRKKPASRPSPKPDNDVAALGNGFVVRAAALVPTSEYSASFLQGMVDRMSVSFFKYGKVADAYPTPVNAIESLLGRLIKYLGSDGLRLAVTAALDKFERATVGKSTDPLGDGNTEWLMDVANFGMIEYMRPRHAKAHFKGTDAHESPGRAMDGLKFANPRHNLDAK